MAEYVDRILLGEMTVHGMVRYDDIMNMPLEDVQPVVRCKDCDSAECSGVMIYCLTHGCYMRDNDFCSYGKREDGERDEC